MKRREGKYPCACVFLEYYSVSLFLFYGLNIIVCLVMFVCCLCVVKFRIVWLLLLAFNMCRVIVFVCV